MKNYIVLHMAFYYNSLFLMNINNKIEFFQSESGFSLSEKLSNSSFMKLAEEQENTLVQQLTCNEQFVLPYDTMFKYIKNFFLAYADCINASTKVEDICFSLIYTTNTNCWSHFFFYYYGKNTILTNSFTLGIARIFKYINSIEQNKQGQVFALHLIKSSDRCRHFLNAYNIMWNSELQYVFMVILSNYNEIQEQFFGLSSCSNEDNKNACIFDIDKSTEKIITLLRNNMSLSISTFNTNTSNIFVCQVYFTIHQKPIFPPNNIKSIVKNNQLNTQNNDLDKKNTQRNFYRKYKNYFFAILLCAITLKAMLYFF